MQRTKQNPINYLPDKIIAWGKSDLERFISKRLERICNGPKIRFEETFFSMTVGDGLKT
jgi:hypothetical protein